MEHASYDWMAGIDDTVREVVRTYLCTVDAEATGLIDGLYLVGSVALADFRPHESDIDFVALCAARPDEESLRALERVHAQLGVRYPRPHFDGVYVTREELSRDPALSTPAPSAHEGKVRSDDFGRDPVTWHTLAHHGVSVRGPALAELEIWTDTAALATWTLDNLDSYWRPWHRRFARLSSPSGLAMLGSWAPAWGVLGVSRLHYTLATGDLTSKSGAGHYALRTFPQRWQEIIEECLRIRRGKVGRSLFPSPLSRRRDALAFIDMAIDDAQRLGRITNR